MITSGSVFFYTVPSSCFLFLFCLNANSFCVSIQFSLSVKKIVLRNKIYGKYSCLLAKHFVSKTRISGKIEMRIPVLNIFICFSVCLWFFLLLLFKQVLMLLCVWMFS